MRRKMRSETPAASRGDRGDRAGAVRRAGGRHAPHVVLPLREHTHVPVKRESETFGDGSSTARRLAYFARGECLKTDCPIGMVERKVELQTQRLSFETSERQAPIDCSYEHLHHDDGPRHVRKGVCAGTRASAEAISMAAHAAVRVPAVPLDCGAGC